jgi:hypothetical protein
VEVVNLTRFARVGAEIGQGKAAAINGLAGPFGMLCASLVGGPLGYYLGLQTVFILFIPAWLCLSLLVLKREPKAKTYHRPARGFSVATMTITLIPLPVMALFPECLSIFCEIEHLKQSLLWQHASKF